MSWLMLSVLSRRPGWAMCALGLAGLAPGACAPAPPPALAGLWSVGEGSCAQGRGVTFEADHVRVHLAEGAAALLEGVRYETKRDGGGLQLRIRHRLPEKPGGVSAAGGVGVIGEDGALKPIAQRFEDGITGSVRAPIRLTHYVQMLNLRSCEQPWPEAGWRSAAGVSAPKRPSIRGRDEG